MQELTYKARRLYRLEIVGFVLLGVVLGAVNVAVQGTWSIVIVLCSLLSFLIASLFFIMARWWVRPLSFLSECVKFGAWEISVNQLSGVEFRPNRKWLIITLKSRVVPHIRLLELTQQSSGSNNLDELRAWALSHNISFNRF